jgi:hypothetical protein
MHITFKMTAFWNTAPCSLTAVEHFRGAYCLHYQVITHHLWNSVLLQWDYSGIYSRKLSSSYSPLWEPEISHISDNWTPNHQLPDKVYQSTGHSTWHETCSSASIDILAKCKNKKPVHVLQFITLLFSFLHYSNRNYQTVCSSIFIATLYGVRHYVLSKLKKISDKSHFVNVKVIPWNGTKFYIYHQIFVSSQCTILLTVNVLCQWKASLSPTQNILQLSHWHEFNVAGLRTQVSMAGYTTGNFLKSWILNDQVKPEEGFGS